MHPGFFLLIRIQHAGPRPYPGNESELYFECLIVKEVHHPRTFPNFVSVYQGNKTKVSYSDPKKKKKKKTVRITDTRIHLVKCPAISFPLPSSKAPATSSSPSLKAKTQLQPTSTLCAPRRLNLLRTLPQDSIRSRLGLNDPRTTILKRRSMSSVVRLIFWYVPSPGLYSHSPGQH